VAEATGRRRTFGPVVLLGVAAGVALAMAGSEAWFVPEDDGSGSGLAGSAYGGDVGVVSSANAVALVGLACWGVLLVTRGRVRRAVALLGLLAGLGSVAIAAVSWGTVPDDVRASFEEISLPAPEVSSTGWYWIGAVVALASLLAWCGAVRWVRDWPEMGRRYDAPAAPSPDDPPEDLWKALDRGHDPTS
jgi:uncharacterized membrane protein (TIGR02234 family)